MTTNIQVFNSPEFGKIRTTVNEMGEPLFAASEIAKALGYENPSEAVIDNCKSGNIATRYIAHSNGIGGVNVNFIPEGEVYRLIMRSQLPTAEKFQDWVCEEVLPSIRKTGEYSIFEPIGGVLPIFYNGKVGYPRKELLIAAGYSPDSGMVSALKKKYPDHFFTLFRTACISAEFAKLRYEQGKVRQLEIQFYANRRISEY
jgi:hypothetical protein